MYSVFFSKFDNGFNLVENRLKDIIKSDDKVVIIPWTFPKEIDEEELDLYFSGKRKDKYLLPLLKLGISSDNIVVLNCYRDNRDKMISIINESSVLVLPGGNPEMFYNKVFDCGFMDFIKSYNKVIIGSSAGSELQLNNYFITAKNNYYKKFAWYKGFGVVDDPFYIDVHSSNNYRYIEKLKKIAIEKEKKVYAIYDDGAVIYNRVNGNVELFGNIKEFDY